MRTRVPEPEDWPARDVARGPVRLHVRAQGSGPAALLLHGFSDDGPCWGRVAVELVRDGWQVVLPDARGHGGTPMPRGEPFAVDAQAADAASVIESLDRPAVLVGHSMGAMTGLLLAAQRPDLVRAAFLEDPAFDVPQGSAADAARDADNPFQEWVRELQALDHAGRVARSREDHPSWPDDERDPWARAKARIDLALFGAPQSWLRRSWQPAATALRVPAAVVAGEPRLGSALTDAAAAWMGEHTTIRVVRVAGAGHNVRREQLTAYLTLLREFLAPYR